MHRKAIYLCARPAASGRRRRAIREGSSASPHSENALLATIAHAED